MQNPLNPNKFMNEMHENELKSFPKHLFSTQNFKKRFLNFLPPNFQTLNIFCIKIIEYIILDGQTKFTHNFMY